MVLSLTACESFQGSAKYHPSTSNVRDMRHINAKFDVRKFSQGPLVKQDLDCRMGGNITVTNGKTYAEYLEAAFVDEFDLAGIYSKNAPNTISAEINEVTFASITPANWKIAGTVNLNGNHYPVTTVFRFDTSYTAYNACKNVADNFGNAVSEFIKDTVNSPNFKSGLKK